MKSLIEQLQIEIENLKKQTSIKTVALRKLQQEIWNREFDLTIPDGEILQVMNSYNGTIKEYGAEDRKEAIDTYRAEITLRERTFCRSVEWKDNRAYFPDLQGYPCKVWLEVVKS